MIEILKGHLCGMMVAIAYLEIGVLVNLIKMVMKTVCIFGVVQDGMTFHVQWYSLVTFVVLVVSIYFMYV